jgi:hypothetical protein
VDCVLLENNFYQIFEDYLHKRAFKKKRLCFQNSQLFGQEGIRLSCINTPKRKINLKGLIDNYGK